MKTRPSHPTRPKKKGPEVEPNNHAEVCKQPESYQDIKNRPPSVIKTWQELMEGERDDETPETPE